MVKLLLGTASAGAVGLRVASGQAAPRVGVLFETPEQFPVIFDEVLRGIDVGLGSKATRFQIRAGTAPSAVNDWLSEPMDGWIVLGARAEAAFVEAGRRTPCSVGLTYFSPAQSPGRSGVSLELSPDAVLPIINTVLPDRDRIHVVYRRGLDEWLIERMDQVARMRGFILRASSISSLTEATDKFLTILKHGDPRSDCMWVMGGAGLANPTTARELIEASLRYRFPMFSSRRGLVDRGVLLGAEASFDGVGRQLADTLLSHLRTGSPSVAATQRLKSLLNVRAARLLGVNVTDALRREIDVLVADD